jgi:hypothetical protein
MFLSPSAESILSGVEGLRINSVDRSAKKNETSDCSALPFLGQI